MAGPGALDGVRVVEVGEGVAGAFAARLLGDLGADVVKVESAAGDPLRATEPLADDGASLLFEYLNWGKRAAVLDAAELARLLEGADVVVDELGPGALATTVDLEAVRTRNPGLVVTAISAFGADGPLCGWTATDLVLQAMGGVMQISGTSDREPLKHGLRQALYCTGLNAAYVALAGVLAARAGGRGADLDLAARDCVASELVLNAAHYGFMGAVQGRRPPAQDPLAGEPLPAADGWVSLQTSGLLPAARLAELFDDPRLAAPELAGTEGRTLHAERLTAILGTHLAGERSADFFVRASQAGFLSGFVQDARELLDCPQLAARGVFHAFDDVRCGGRPVRFPAVVAALSRTPAQVRRRAPRHGEHTAAVRQELGRARRPARRAPARALAPLAGVRVIDLSTVFAVPYLGGLLADLGAEVIKVEAPQRLDQTRAFYGPYYDNDPGDGWWDRSATFQIVNRGKRSVALDLKTPEGRDVLRSLIAVSDVLLDNFTPRVLRGWDLAPDDVAALNPRVVMLSNTGYGSTGPWASFRAQGTSLEATMGITHVTGYPDGKPSKAGQSYPDFLACWAGLTAVLAALLERDRSGRGQWIDLGMYQLGAAVIPEALLAVQATGQTPPRQGSTDLGALLSGLFPSVGEDRWLAVSAGDRAQLDALRGVVDPRGHADAEPAAVARALADWAARREAATAASELQAAGVAAGPVLDAHDLLLDPQLRHRGFYAWLDYGPPLGRRPLIGRPYRWAPADEGPAIRTRAPDFGEGNRYVLEEVLGLDAASIHRLYAAGAVADAPVRPRADQPPIDLRALLAVRALTRIDDDYAERLAGCAPAT